MRLCECVKMASLSEDVVYILRQIYGEYTISPEYNESEKDLLDAVLDRLEIPKTNKPGYRPSREIRDICTEISKKITYLMDSNFRNRHRFLYIHDLLVNHDRPKNIDLISDCVQTYNSWMFIPVEILQNIPNNEYLKPTIAKYREVRDRWQQNMCINGGPLYRNIINLYKFWRDKGTVPLPGKVTVPVTCPSVLIGNLIFDENCEDIYRLIDIMNNELTHAEKESFKKLFPGRGELISDSMYLLYYNKYISDVINVWVKEKRYLSEETQRAFGKLRDDMDRATSTMGLTQKIKITALIKQWSDTMTQIMVPN